MQGVQPVPGTSSSVTIRPSALNRAQLYCVRHGTWSSVRLRLQCYGCGSGYGCGCRHGGTWSSPSAPAEWSLLATTHLEGLQLRLLRLQLQLQLQLQLLTTPPASRVP